MQNLGLYQISVETGDLAAGASIAAYLTSAAGTLITSSVVGGKNAVDVKDVADYATDAASTAGDNGQLGLAVRHDADTTIATVDGNYAPLQLDANGALKISGTITVTDNAEYAEDSPFTNGDIGIFTLLVRQDTLAASTSADGDFGAFKSNNLGELYVHDTSALAELVLIKGDTASIVTNTASSASSLTALSHLDGAVWAAGSAGIEALAVRHDAQSASTGVADGDWSPLQTWSEGSLKVVDVSNATLLQQQISVANTATQLPAAPLANRKSIMVQNAGSASIWVGSATVTSGTSATAGIIVPKGGYIELEVGPAVPVYAIAATGSVLANILESA